MNRTHEPTPATQQSPRLAVAASVLAAAAMIGSAQESHAADPFLDVNQSALLQRGWKRVADFPAAGVFVGNGKTVVAWNRDGFSTSQDQGWTWSNPINPSTFGQQAAPGQTTITGGYAPIAECVIAGQDTVYIRSTDGVIRTGGGMPMNTTWGMGASSRMAVDGQGSLYAEQADGTKTIAVGPQGQRAEAPGRLAFAFKDAAVTVMGTKAWKLTPMGAMPIAIATADKTFSRTAPLASGPGTHVQRAIDGSSWMLKDGTLKATGAFSQVDVISWGPSRSRDKGVIGLVRNTQGLDVIQHLDSENRGGITVVPLTNDPGSIGRQPDGIACTADLGLDRGDSQRTLHAVSSGTDAGIWMHRAR